MKVILKVDIKGSGKAGQLIEVSDGYARNYLLPKNLAEVADKSALNQLKTRAEAQKHHEETERAQAQATAEAVKNKSVTCYAKAGHNETGQSGRLFGSVTTKEVAEAIKSQLGIEVDRRKISLDGDIKAFGTYKAQVKLKGGITASLDVVVAEEH